MCCNNSGIFAPGNSSVPSLCFEAASTIAKSCFLPELRSLATMPEPPQGADDPHKVWQVFKSVFKNLSSSRAASQELQYLTSLTQIVSEYPQALVATSAWPDIGERGRRREAVTSALVRRLLHCQAARAEVSQTMSATEELLKLIISVLHKHSLTRCPI